MAFDNPQVDAYWKDQHYVVSWTDQELAGRVWRSKDGTLRLMGGHPTVSKEFTNAAIEAVRLFLQKKDPEPDASADVGARVKPKRPSGSSGATMSVVREVDTPQAVGTPR